MNEALPQIQPHANHRATGIDEGRGLPEVRAEQVVGCQALARRVVQRVRARPPVARSALAPERDCPREVVSPVLDTLLTGGSCCEPHSYRRGWTLRAGETARRAKSLLPDDLYVEPRVPADYCTDHAHPAKTVRA